MNEILEEQCNIQEKLILKLYKDLEYFTTLEETAYFEDMQNKLRYARVKAKKMRKELENYITD